jgi:hypothetical protein
MNKIIKFISYKFFKHNSFIYTNKYKQYKYLLDNNMLYELEYELNKQRELDIFKSSDEYKLYQYLYENNILKIPFAWQEDYAKLNNYINNIDEINIQLVKLYQTLKLVSDFFIANADIIQNNINYSNYYKFILTNFLNIYSKLLNTPFQYQYLDIYNEIYNKYKLTIKNIIKLKPLYNDINTYIYLEYELLLLFLEKLYNFKKNYIIFSKITVNYLE